MSGTKQNYKKRLLAVHQRYLDQTPKVNFQMPKTVKKVLEVHIQS